MGRYRLTRKADADLASIYRYGVRTFGIAGADRYYDSLVRQLDRIGETPLLYQKSDYREGYRRAVHPPHTIYYRMVDADTAEIVRILYGQDPRDAL